MKKLKLMKLLAKLEREYETLSDKQILRKERIMKKYENLYKKYEKYYGKPPI